MALHMTKAISQELCTGIYQNNDHDISETPYIVVTDFLIIIFLLSFLVYRLCPSHSKASTRLRGGYI